MPVFRVAIITLVTSETDEVKRIAVEIDGAGAVTAQTKFDARVILVVRLPAVVTAELTLPDKVMPPLKEPETPDVALMEPTSLIFVVSVAAAVDTAVAEPLKPAPDFNEATLNEVAWPTALSWILAFSVPVAVAVLVRVAASLMAVLMLPEILAID